MAPPAQGAVLLLPLWPSARPVDAALDSGMRIVAAARLNGVVARSGGQRDDGRLLRRGVLALAPLTVLCGETA